MFSIALPVSLNKALLMKHRLATFGPLLGALLASPYALAGYGENGCYWEDQWPGTAQVVFNIPPTLHIPQDAPVGTIIGGQTFRAEGIPVPFSIYICDNNSANGPMVRITYNAYNVAPLATLEGGLPRVPLPFPEEKIIRTNIPGVGASIKMERWIGAAGDLEYNFWLQDPEARVPFTATRNHFSLSPTRVPSHIYYVSLVKTGTIPAGLHSFDPNYQIIRADIMHPLPGLDTVLNFRLSGDLISSGCQTATDPVTPNPVDLGEFDVKDFEQANSGSTPIRFDLNLVDCQPPSQGTVPRVHVQMDPDNGSTTLDAANGLFSTGSGTTGSGVAFQLLKQDAIAAMPLNTKVPIMTLPTGSMKVPFNVRLVKHNGAVVPGTLTGALRFLRTYE
jgi:type 1 fimbria pilin